MGNIISNLFGGGKAPKIPEPPPEPKAPTAADREEAAKRKRAAALASGRESTILAGRTLGSAGLGAARLPTLLGRAR